MTVNLTRDGCAPTGVVSRAGDRAPECLDRVEALADKHGIDRDFARRLAAALHGYQEAA